MYSNCEISKSMMGYLKLFFGGPRAGCVCVCVHTHTIYTTETARGATVNQAQSSLRGVSDQLQVKTIGKSVTQVKGLQWIQAEGLFPEDDWPLAVPSRKGIINSLNPCSLLTKGPLTEAIRKLWMAGGLPACPPPGFSPQNRDWNDY
jgi:acyl-CoA synthetase (AMP-forming)/AMP-acid ligase II